MNIRHIFAKYQRYILPIALVIISLILLLTGLGRAALTDYDEATYARVIHDTLQSNDLLTLKNLGQPWFEKPPLYYWLSMLFVGLFGESEAVLRLGSALFAVLCLWLVYKIVLHLSGRAWQALFSGLMLLSTSMFYYFSREVRLDTGVIAAILAAFYFLIVSREKPKRAVMIGIFLGIGFMIKSVIVLLFIPVAFIYAWIFRSWSWLKNKYTYLGLSLGLLLAAPWHIVQTVRFGESFWQSYLGIHVIGRALEGIGKNAENGGNDFFDFPIYLWQNVQPFTSILVVSILTLAVYYIIKKKMDRLAIFSLLSALVISLFFSLSKTHIATYILPIYPWLAIFIGSVLFSVVASKLWRTIFFITILTVTFVFIKNSYVYAIFPYHIEQKLASQEYFKLSQGLYPLYVLHWPTHESIRYYSGSIPSFVTFSLQDQRVIPADSYIILNNAYLPYFADDSGQPLPQFENIKVYYVGKYLSLLYTAEEAVIEAGYATDQVYYVVE